MHNAWGITWGDSWGWSWGPLYEVEEGRRPRTNPIKLQKIRDAKVPALHAHASTRARFVHATGATHIEIARPQRAVHAVETARTCKTHTRSHNIKGNGAACCPALHIRARTVAKPQQFAAGAGTAALRARAGTYVHTANASGGATTQLHISSTTGTYCERVRARGTQRISDATLAAVVAVVTQKY